MARQVGTFKINGTIGDLTFYQSQGEHFVRSKGGVDGNRIKNDPNFARTRENMSEFGRAGQDGKMIRDALRTLLEKASDSRVTSSLTAKLMEVIKTDTENVRGERSVEKGDQLLLKGFEFNKNVGLANVLFAEVTETVDLNTPEASCVINLNAQQDLKAPTGATHYQITYAAMGLFFDGSGVQGLTVAESGIKPITNVEEALNLVTPEPNLVTADTNFTFLMVEFYQEVNGQNYPLGGGANNCLHLLNVVRA
ncbi:hypothetical protein [Xanthovirga aplysinae]|uniref:hypothetical protein n=1 Tax=Xanthovirga aplysinae TaxID=2529853 RepID=UPI0012BD5234|nr:hypothetical protein [Xanthovirga aplysinae]MTI29470.1 hypothetical protein [Xanthovirga aplysinae]